VANSNDKGLLSVAYALMAAWQSRRARACRNCTAPADHHRPCEFKPANRLTPRILAKSAGLLRQSSNHCNWGVRQGRHTLVVHRRRSQRAQSPDNDVTGTVLWCFSGTKIICRRDALRAYWERRLNDCPASELDDLQPVRSGVGIAYLSRDGLVLATLELNVEGQTSVFKSGPSKRESLGTTLN
jgi:hypothetical protein